MFVKKGRVFCSYMDSRGQSVSFRYSAEHIFVSGRFQNHHGVKTAQLGKKKLEKSKVFIIKTGKAVKKRKINFAAEMLEKTIDKEISNHAVSRAD